VIGKPSSVFFNQAARMIGMSPGDLVMIGDDVDSDVGGAMNAGTQGILVKTGKYRSVSINFSFSSFVAGKQGCLNLSAALSRGECR
jgi:ribonucleotide monophosphatase NagD (HAD superfamily)